MLKLIYGGEVYAPDYLGRQDILVAFDRILAIRDTVALEALPVPVTMVDASGKIVVPGLIDQHLHLIGGGGEGGFHTRTQEITLEEIVTGGITTAVGLLGVDNVTRQMTALLAKAKALEAEGLTTFIYAGAYFLSGHSVTDTLMSDIMLLDKVIGVGELAIADHRSGQLSKNELAKIAAQAGVGGLLSGKAGVVHLHVGDGRSGISQVLEIIRETDLPASQFVPTHLNRSETLLEQGLEFIRMGGTIDLTAGVSDQDRENGFLSVAQALTVLRKRGVPVERVTVSSDGNGSAPVFDARENLIGIRVSRVNSLWNDLREVAQKGILSLSDSLRLATENVARVLKLPAKGRLAPGQDADLLVVSRDLEIDVVLARGKILAKNGKAIHSTLI